MQVSRGAKPNTLVEVSSKKQTAPTTLVRKHLSNFFGQSTIHGLHYCFDGNLPMRRVVWCCLVLGALALALQKISESATEYLSYPISTVNTIRYEETMVFPAVTLCNMNDWRLSVTVNTSLFYTVTSFYNTGEKKEVSAEELLATQRRANHRLENMLLSCKWKGQSCGLQNFSEYFTVQGERCYTFNSGRDNHSTLYAETASIIDSLELILNVEYYDYFIDNFVSGIRIILHSQEELPVTSQGYVLTAGDKTYIKVKKTKARNLPYPYKTNCSSIPLKYFNKYTADMCWLEQLTDHVTSKCGCRDVCMPGNASVCPLSVMDACGWAEWDMFNIGKLAKCPLPCEVDKYSALMSHAHMAPSIVSTTLTESLRIERPTMAHETFVGENVIRAVIYYEDLSYVLIEQEPTYTLMKLLGDIGGNLGLLVGASVLSYMEIIDCIILIVITLIKNSRSSSKKQKS